MSAGAVAAAIAQKVIPLVAPQLFSFAGKALSSIGRDKKGAAALLRMQESDLRAVAKDLATLAEDKDCNLNLERRSISIWAALVARSAEVSDAAADMLVGDDDVAPSKR